MHAIKIILQLAKVHRGPRWRLKCTPLAPLAVETRNTSHPNPANIQTPATPAPDRYTDRILAVPKRNLTASKWRPKFQNISKNTAPTIFPKIYFKNSYLPRFLTKFNLQGVILSATPRAFQWRHEARNRPKSARNMNHRKFPGVIFQKFVTPASFGRF